MHTPADHSTIPERPFALFYGERGTLWISTCVASALKLESVTADDRAGLRSAQSRAGLVLAVLDLDLLGPHATATVEELSHKARVLGLTSGGLGAAASVVDAGAIDVLAKPSDPADRAWLNRLSAAVRAMGSAPKMPVRVEPEAIKSPAFSGAAGKLVLIAGGLGGFGQLARVIGELPKVTPGVVVVHHSAEGLGVHLADRLRARTELTVRVLRDGDAILPGTVGIAPQGFHTAIRTTGTSYTARVFHGPSVAGGLPSANVLLDSAARYAGLNAIGLLLDSDSEDGARGLLALRQAGGRTLCLGPQSTVFGVSARAAAGVHAAQAAVEIDAVSRQILGFARGAALVA